MSANPSRAIIETLVRKTIREMQDSPRRSVRNLVDLALQFSGGRLQHRFFQAAQTLLKNENSPYYDLAQDVVNHVDPEQIVTLGMNVGYNGCTYGAKKLREAGRQTPWTIFLSARDSAERQQLQTVTAQGESQGVYTWQIFADCQPEELLPLASLHPDGAFMLYCQGRAITPDFCQRLLQVKNVMPVICYDDSAPDACAALRAQGVGYSVYHVYHPAGLQEVLSGDLMYSAQQLHPIFTALLPARQCPRPLQEEVHRRIQAFRESQLFQTIPWEALHDSCLVDQMLRGQPTATDRFISRETSRPLCLFPGGIALDQQLQAAFPGP